MLKRIHASLKFCLIILSLCTSIFSYAMEDKSLSMLRTSYQTIFSHLLRQDIHPGAVIASPSQNQPNYFYHWVRDAGLTMLELVSLYQLPLAPERQKLIESFIQAWINFEIQNQNKALTLSNLGEPIFTVIGEIYPHPWGRPQNDGPAIRSIAMTLYSFELIKQKRFTEAKRLYRAEFPSTSPIKIDLEYISAHWNDPCFDLWEEVNGNHFFSKMAQRAALILGASLANFFQDNFAGAYYLNKAKEIEASIYKHVNRSRNFIVPTINPLNGWKGKDSELDTSTILALLYFTFDDNFFRLNDPVILNTLNNIESTFSRLYKINQTSINSHFPLSPAIGRYPEDVYNGSGFSEGNPWFITTNAFAEIYCRLANLDPKGPNYNSFKNKGIGFLNRVLIHSDANGHMSEQFNRHNGFMQGAQDLTWSYVSYLRAYRSCQNQFQYNKLVPQLLGTLKL